MFKRHMINSIIVIFFILLISNVTFAQNAIMDLTNLDKGIVGINYNKNVDNIKVLISKGNNKENYDLSSNMNYPLQFGDGIYSIQILKHVAGNKYRQLQKETIKLQLKDQQSLFLQSIHMVNWDAEMVAIKKAKDLTKDLKTDEEKVKAIYDYVTNNIKYDKKKANSVKYGYLPSIDSTIETKTGICHDYSVLTAAMLRSVDIPTKLIMGYKSDITSYHAWNEVYLNGKWEIIDTTYDSAYAEKTVSINMIKNISDYRVEKTY